MAKFTAEKINGMAVVVKVYLQKGESEFNFFLSPDHHWDNPKCQRDLLKADLDEAKRLNAAIVMPGDTFCFMQGKYDPRRNKADIRPEHNVSNYIDAVISDAAKWYGPYKQNMVAIGTGNHESAILKSLETNVLERFAGEMGQGLPVMGYHFWVILKIHDHAGRQRWFYKIYCDHGTGGGGAVTRGQIEFSRVMMKIEGADCVSMGHVHEKNNSEVLVHYFDNTNTSYKAKAKSMLLIRSSTYKQEYTKNGYHIEKGRPPKPLGGTFVTLYCNRGNNNDHILAEAKIRTGQPFEIS